jgi:hypothetical protein
VEHLSDKAIAQLQAIVAVYGRGLTSKTMRVQGPVEPFAATVAGKSAAGAVATMRRRRQADDEEARLRISKTRHWFAPIGLTAKTPHLLHCHLLQIGDQARA